VGVALNAARIPGLENFRPGKNREGRGKMRAAISYDRGAETEDQRGVYMHRKCTKRLNMDGLNSIRMKQASDTKSKKCP